MIRAAEQSIDTQQMLDLNEEVSSSTMTLGESSKKNTVNEPHHASYLTMIKGVVQALNESEEADKSAILKSLAQHYHVGGNITKDNSHMCTTRREVHEEDGIEQAMIKAAEQSMSMQGMLDASGPFPSAGMPLHKLSEKKKKILDKKNPIPGPHHPTYLTMIKGAVLALNESKGASKPAILKYLAQHYQLGENLPKINSHLCMALRKALREGNIEQTTGHGASGSFKMSPTTSKKIRPKIAKRKAAKSALPKIKRVIKKRAVVAKTVKPKVVRKPIKKPKVKKAIKKKVIKKIVPVDGKLRVKKKRVVVKSKTPLAKKT